LAAVSSCSAGHIGPWRPDQKFWFLESIATSYLCVAEQPDVDVFRTRSRRSSRDEKGQRSICHQAQRTPHQASHMHARLSTNHRSSPRLVSRLGNPRVGWIRMSNTQMVVCCAFFVLSFLSCSSVLEGYRGSDDDDAVLVHARYIRPFAHHLTLPALGVDGTTSLEGSQWH
jgi:hypothetical protein